MGKVLKFLFKLLITAIIIAILLFGLSVLLEKKVVNKAVSLINKRITVPVHVDNITFTLLRKFPNATLRLTNVTVLSGDGFNKNEFKNNSGDTLLHANELFLSVDILAFTKNKLIIQKAYIHNGFINLLVDKKGNNNYTFTYGITTKTDTSLNNKNMRVMLKQIQLKKFETRIVNRYKSLQTVLYAPEYNINGSFYKKNYTVNTTGKLLIKYFSQGKIFLKPANPARIAMNISINNDNIIINESSLTSSFIKLSAKGSVIIGQEPILDLQIFGNTVALDYFTDYVNFKSSLKDLSGSIAFSAIAKGRLSSTQNPYMAVNFAGSNISASLIKYPFSFSNFEFKGSFNNGTKRNNKTSIIKLDEFKVASGKNNINGRAKISNFINPYFTLNTNINYLNIADFFTSSTNGITINGIIKGDATLSGFINEDTDILKSINKKAVFHLYNADYSDKDILISNTNAVVKINNKDINADSVNMQFFDSNIKGKIKIADYVKLLSDTLQPYNISASLNADRFVYDKFKNLFTNESSSQGRQSNINCYLNIDNLYYENLHAKSVKGHLHYETGQLQITGISANTLQGTVKGDFNYTDKKGNKTYYKSHVSTNRVNIKTLYKTFNNFGQESITYKNIDGMLTSDFDVDFYTKNGEFSSNTLELLGHLKIEDGRLKNFAPAQEVARFSEINDLSDIKFDIIENDILISNGTVHIPEMFIKSNAFDIKLYGKQSFNGDYEYHMKINLSDFLSGKSKRLAKQQSQFGYIEDDGYGRKPLFIVVSSKGGESHTALDKQEIKSNIKNNVNEEKREFKKALHDEFGLFKNDSNLNKSEKKSKEPAFIIEWDEE